MLEVMAGQTAPLVKRVIQLGRPANLILEPEQLPGVQARIGKEGPRRNDMAAQEVSSGLMFRRSGSPVRPGQECWRGSQDEAGVATLTRRLQQLKGGIGRVWNRRRLGGLGLANRSGEPTRSATLPAPWASWPIQLRTSAKPPMWSRGRCPQRLRYRSPGPVGR